MRKVEDYLRHAAECWDMARSASPSHRQQLEQMAETWSSLLSCRRQLSRRGETEDKAPDE